MDRDRYDYLSGQILDSCIEVHRHLGQGLLESVYQYALMIELELREISAKQNVLTPLYYKEFDTGKFYQTDILVEDEIILHPGFLVNFNVPLLKNGFKRFVNNF